MNSPNFDQTDSAPVDNLSSTDFLTLANPHSDEPHTSPDAREAEFDRYIENFELKAALLHKRFELKKLSPLRKQIDLSVHHTIEQDFNRKDKKRRHRIKYHF